MKKESYIKACQLDSISYQIKVWIKYYNTIRWYWIFYALPT